MPESFFTSFRHACRGLWTVFRDEKNFRLQTLAGSCAIGSGLFFGIGKTEWFFLLFVIALVLLLEIANTFLERILDLVKPRLHPQVHDLKDMLAGAVLLAAMLSLVVGFWIFGSRIWEIVVGKV